MGIAVTHALGDGRPPSSGYLPVALAGGLATGVLQAAVLRTPSWAVATTAAFVLGIGGQAITRAAGFGSVFEEHWTLRHAIISGLAGALDALVTAPLIARIRPENGLPILGKDGAA
ncbi:MAG TPA: hypothetical protein DCK98_13930 [Chloroflexi bacterium]|nr:hypothetical protein [Chloroflexota bacterium]HAL28255.1 hypothetical protein [Chloroflexota bacterium]